MQKRNSWNWGNLLSNRNTFYIKNVRIEEQVNEHGTMTVRFLSRKQLTSADVV